MLKALHALQKENQRLQEQIDLYLVMETLKATKTVILKSEKQYIFWDPVKCFGPRYEHEVRVLGGGDCGRASSAHPLQVRGCLPAATLFSSSFRPL